MFNKDILVAEGMSITHRIEDTDTGNVAKYQFSTLPGFDEVNFPFIAVSGLKSLNLVNVRTGSIQVLISAPIITYRNQKAFFFTSDNDGLQLHFTV